MRQRKGELCLSELLRRLFLAWLIAVSSLGLAFGEQSHSGQVLPGGSSKEPINVDAAKLDYFDKEQKLVYTGNVIATQGESKLQAVALVVFLTPKDPNAKPGAPSSASQVRRMEATGPVTITSKDQIGTGDSGYYEKSENKVYLIGNVTLTQGPNVTTGDKLVYDLTTNRAAVTGRVRSLFVPSGEGEKESKPAKPDGSPKADRAAKIQ
ncbi:MAG TPA: LptA/OstA family protein [Methylocella sp.]|nr:LptA/OstA family protein [Methylocella sp.]